MKVRENGRWVTAKVTAITPTFIIAKNPYKNLGNTFDIARKEVHGATMSVEWLRCNGWSLKNECDYGFRVSELVMKKIASTGITLHAYNGLFCFYKGNTPISREFNALHDLQNIFEDIFGEPMWIDDMLKPILSSS